MLGRQQYTKEWKVEAVRLANEPDQSVVQIAKNLGSVSQRCTARLASWATKGRWPFPVMGKQG